ncbi:MULTISPECIES: DNA primase [unclassified Streptomyces]|uniref:DNA primase n=1 Tax=unclassified Streptomyces TaxID=2593676 RepID=UPI002366BA49|nr:MULTISPECIES: DNA primase [unclassified Streptomyces]MDF3145630.1 DNA primase [Streptomyces sp. T21Q-yed]WDF42625.1 DNA primase [Streptomyces sp. T12]
MNRVGLGLAVGAGYVLGRTKKMKLAFAVGTLVAGKRMHLSPRAVTDMVSQQLQNNPQFKEIGEQLREDLRGVGGAASSALVERRLDALADRLHGRTAEMREQLSGAVPTPDLGAQDEESDEETEATEDEEPRAEDEDRESDEPEGHEESEESEEAEEEPEDEEPSGKAASKRAAPKKTAKKAAKKAPAKKTAAKKKTTAGRTAPKKAAAKRSGTGKSAARKTTGTRTAARSGRAARRSKGGDG